MSAAQVTQADVSCLTQSAKTFTRQSGTEEFKVVNEVDYSFKLRTFSRQRVAVSYAFSPTDASSTSALFDLTQVFEVSDYAYNPKFELVLSYAYDRNCQPILASTERVHYKKLPSGQVEVTTVSQDTGSSPDRTTVLLSKEVSRNSALMARIDSVQDAHKLGLIGKNLEVYVEGMVAIYRLENIPARALVNRITGQKENLLGLHATVMDRQRKILATADIFQKWDKSYGYTSSESFGTANFEQDIGEREWFMASLEESQEFEPKIIGFSSVDWAQRSLTFSLSTKGPLDLFSNSSAYFTAGPPLQRNGKSTIRVRSYDQPKPKVIFAWDHPNAEGDRPFLQSSKYIQLDAVTAIANKIRPILRGKNRLEAAIIIVNALQQYLEKFDQESADLGMVNVQNTRDILKSRKGVCQHYAALFVAIARRLGIPSRIVAGYLVDELSAGGHAWVEVKLNDTSWWPLEPQAPNVDALPSRSYLPQAIYSLYEVPVDRPEMETETMIEYTRNIVSWRELTIRKIKTQKR